MSGSTSSKLASRLFFALIDAVFKRGSITFVQSSILPSLCSLTRNINEFLPKEFESVNVFTLKFFSICFFLRDVINLLNDQISSETRLLLNVSKSVLFWFKKKSPAWFYLCIYLFLLEIWKMKIENWTMKSRINENWIHCGNKIHVENKIIRI